MASTHTMINQVFISYRHQSPEHARAVRRLGELLRQAKLPVLLDQFFMDDKPGGPDETWPRWCEVAATQSASVIIIGSQGWFDCYEGKAKPGNGLGAAYEAQHFRQYLYNQAGNNPRIRLVYLNDMDRNLVPSGLQGWHHFQPFDDRSQLDGMVKWIAQCLGISDAESPTVCWPEPIAFQPDLADRSEEEWPAIRDLLSGCSRHRILLYQGASGLGKSLLLRQAAQYAKSLVLPVVYIDLKDSSLDLDSLLGCFDNALSGLLPNFTRSPKAHLLRKDLRGLRQPFLAIFDTYEAIADNPILRDWLNLQFLAEVETALGMAVIIAGQKVPEARNAIWGEQARHLPMHPITEVEDWLPWVQRRYPQVEHRKAHLPTLLMLSNGTPSIFANLCEAIANGGAQP
jgi:hypothetical protein